MSNGEKYSSIEGLKAFSDQKIATLRHQMEAALSGGEYADRLTVVVTGSYGRREATEHSDLDYYIFLDADLPAEEVVADELKAIAAMVAKEVPGSVGDTKTFGCDAIVNFKEMLGTIGGAEDTNQSMTRRMLFLLEGDWLYNEKRFMDYRERLLRRYLRPDARPDAVPLFLLNDIIRYYRTITTDLEYKVTEQGKPWGLRNIKLRFSRKLIYFGGIIVAAELVGKDHAARLEESAKLFSMPVTSRILTLDDSRYAEEIMRIYDLFLGDMAQKDVRAALEAVERENRWESEVYRRLREQGHGFSHALSSWLDARYSSHPIHQALIF